MKPSKKPDPKPLDWSRVTDDELLKMRICDLPISMDETDLVDWIHEIYAELTAKGIDFHPEVYLGDEWFSPDGDPVVSIPFYLAQPRLIDLEKRRVLEAEGEDREQFANRVTDTAGERQSDNQGDERDQYLQDSGGITPERGHSPNYQDDDIDPVHGPTPHDTK